MKWKLEKVVLNYMYACQSTKESTPQIRRGGNRMRCGGVTSDVPA